MFQPRLSVRSILVVLALGFAGCGGELYPGDEEVGDDGCYHDHDGMRLFAAQSCGGKVPTVPSFSKAIDPLAAYVSQSQCSPTAKPGVTEFSKLILATYGCTASYGIIRGCSVGGKSEHKEGRAWDWGVAVGNAAANDVLNWLLATDSHGNKYAMARRFGIMYIVFNRKIWGAYRADDGWRTYTGSNPHTDHVHFSFSWDGANKKTSYWTGATAPPPPPPPPPPPAKPDYAATLVRSSIPKRVQSGKQVEAWFELKNTGAKSWNKPNTRLGTTRPRDRASDLFEKGSWLAAHRPTAVDAATAPGAVGRFTFTIQAPPVDAPTAITENFGLVQEGVTWFGPQTMTVEIEVTPAAQIDTTPPPAAAPSAGEPIDPSARPLDGSPTELQGGCVVGAGGGADRGVLPGLLALLFVAGRGRRRSPRRLRSGRRRRCAPLKRAERSGRYR